MQTTVATRSGGVVDEIEAGGSWDDLLNGMVSKQARVTKKLDARSTA